MMKKTIAGVLLASAFILNTAVAAGISYNYLEGSFVVPSHIENTDDGFGVIGGSVGIGKNMALELKGTDTLLGATASGRSGALKLHMPLMKKMDIVGGIIVNDTGDFRSDIENSTAMVGVRSMLSDIVEMNVEFMRVGAFKSGSYNVVGADLLQHLNGGPVVIGVGVMRDLENDVSTFAGKVRYHF